MGSVDAATQGVATRPDAAFARFAFQDPATGSALLTYSEHLRELRDRLVKSIIALVVGMALALLVADGIFQVLLWPAGGLKLIATGVTEAVGAYIKVAFISGLVIATPVWLFQVIAFVSPGLTKGERRVVYLSLPGVLLCFGCGVLFGYFVLLPPALKFLLEFKPDLITTMPRVGDYVSVVSGLLFWLGLVFEMPLVIYLLARVGVVTPQSLSRFRRYAIVGAFVAAAVITPTVDPVNQALVAVPIVLLYELGILLSRIAVRARGKTAAP